MSSPEVTALIVTTAHDRRDGRLRRHIEVLEERGIAATIAAMDARSRAARFLGSPWFIWRAMKRPKPSVVMFPDPETFVVGPLLARLRGVRAVIDVHEDYAAVALTRSWIPPWLRHAVGLLSRANLWLGRHTAHATIVAAESLTCPGAVVVANLPHRMPVVTPQKATLFVYVGDVTELRGALDIARLAREVPAAEILVIGPISESLKARMSLEAAAGGHQLQFTGRLAPTEAWARAATATAGLALLHDTPAYRHSVPTKIYEYMAHGLAVIATDLPGQRTTVETARCGAVVTSAEELAEVVRYWIDHPSAARDKGAAGRHFVADLIAADRSADHLVAAITGQPMPSV